MNDNGRNQNPFNNSAQNAAPPPQQQQNTAMEQTHAEAALNRREAAEPAFRTNCLRERYNRIAPNSPPPYLGHSNQHQSNHQPAFRTNGVRECYNRLAPNFG